MKSKPLNIICFATFFKGGDFMRECQAQGGNVILVTKEKMLHEDWPRDVITEIFALPNDAPVELFLDLVSHIAGTRKPDRIVALEEFDVVIAALAREHLCLPGLNSSTAKTFRDKLSMSIKARDAGLRVPDFVPAINHEEIAEYLVLQGEVVADGERLERFAWLRIPAGGCLAARSGKEGCLIWRKVGPSPI